MRREEQVKVSMRSRTVGSSEVSLCIYRGVGKWLQKFIFRINEKDMHRMLDPHLNSEIIIINSGQAIYRHAT